MTPESSQIRISAKTLGSLALEDFCPRCFWLKMKLEQKLPWFIFPGIFSSIDSYSKNITWSYFDKYGKLPKWFAPYGTFMRPVQVPHHTRFFVIDEKNNKAGKREVVDTFAGKENRDAHIRLLKAEAERQKQAKDLLKKQIASFSKVEDTEEIRKLADQIGKIQKLQQKQKAEDGLKQTEERLEGTRDEITKMKAVVPEFDRIK